MHVLNTRMLTISNLHVSVGEKEILKGLSLTVKPGEIHAVMGPNGSGKSTLAYALMGNPMYKILNSKSETPVRQIGGRNPKFDAMVKLDTIDLLELPPDGRAKAGLFLAFQQPVGIPGVSVRKFLRAVGKSRSVENSNKKQDVLSNAIEIHKRLDMLAEELYVHPDLLSRDLNDNFSGGEKKKIETLQMMFLSPKYAIIDEVDTGLDIDALRVVAGGIATLSKKGTGFIIITHYQRILKYLKPDRVHVMKDGKIVVSGPASLAKTIEEKGYTHVSTGI